MSLNVHRKESTQRRRHEGAFFFEDFLWARPTNRIRKLLKTRFEALRSPAGERFTVLESGAAAG